MSRPLAVITGAARGVGAEVARQLAARGHRLALVGLEPTELARVAAECGPDARWWEADVTDSARMDAVAAEVEQQLGPADVLLVNAGIAVGAPFGLAEAAAFDRVIEVNLLGSVRTVRAFLPQLRTTRGYVLQVASLAALTPAPMMAAYCASKSGVEAFALSITPELAVHGVDVGVAYLSWTDTDMVRGADQVGPLAAQRRSLPPPFNRTYPLPQAAAQLVAGIEKRAGRVYAPGWIRAVVPARHFAGLVTVLGGKARTKQLAAAEREIQTSYADALREAVGAGGRADRAPGGQERGVEDR